MSQMHTYINEMNYRVLGVCIHDTTLLLCAVLVASCASLFVLEIIRETLTPDHHTEHKNFLDMFYDKPLITLFTCMLGTYIVSVVIITILSAICFPFTVCLSGLCVVFQNVQEEYHTSNDTYSENTQPLVSDVYIDTKYDTPNYNPSDNTQPLVHDV